MTKRAAQTTKGESILELLLAVAIFSIVLPSLLYVVGTTADRQASKNSYNESLLLLEDVKDVVRQKKANEWDFFAQNATYVASREGQTWVFEQVGEQQTPSAQNNVVVTVRSQEARRSVEGDLVETGGYVDPATRKIDIIVDWLGAVSATQSSLYITRTDNIKSVEIKSKDEFENGATFDGVVAVTGMPSENDGLIIGVDAPGPASGALGYWNMNGENQSLSTEIDLAEGGVDNMSFGGSPQFVQSQFGKGLSTGVNGARLYASPSARLDISGDISVAIWLKNLSDPQAPQTILDKHDTGGGYIVRLMPGGKIELMLSDATESVSVQTQSTLLDGLWHLVGFSYDGANLNPYFDGIQNGPPAPKIAQLFQGPNIISIGNDNAIATTPFGGVIDDLQIYGTSLEAADFMNITYPKYESKAVDLGSNSLIHAFAASVNLEQGASLGLQFSVRNKVLGVCEKPTVYVGPDGQTNSYFVINDAHEQTPSIPFPIGDFAGSAYSNPGECVAFKIMVLSSGSTQVSTPIKISNVKILYSL